MNEAAIAVKGLKKSYKKVPVLKGVDFVVKPGRVFCLLGSNGAGKTTTVKILSTLISYEDGEVQVGGFDLARQPRRIREKISLTGQYAAVDEAQTGRENMQMIAQLRHLKGIAAKNEIEGLLSHFDLLEAADRPASTYSGGMRRKLDLAMSLVGNPSIIFLDEPTVGLDPQSRLAMWDVIKAISKRGTTIFLTTQYLEEAERLADYVAILDKGVIVAEGNIEELKTMLPKGTLSFSFTSEADMCNAVELLAGYKLQADKGNLSISVITDGSLEDLSNISGKLKDINISSFAQQIPTLEDVFLSIIDDGKHRKTV
jgi:ABC-2 type transport system ATP-binding protein